jgi:hypothetical protein
MNITLHVNNKLMKEQISSPIAIKILHFHIILQQRKHSRLY